MAMLLGMLCGLGYGSYAGGSWWIMGIGMILNLLFWGTLIYLAVRYFNRRGTSNCCAGHDQHSTNLSTQTESAEEILRQRYARGEITREQYLEMLETLHK